ncbi:cell wall / vacuolar inhibitor of fructosidase 1-like [Bidens hawaiensis]|uniref:cell wall / vacuolar inhibitor of fructosidase 1-like n=1 Tax=Bidens hawaiensis TaxID=980011 RepID=UPI00404A23B5
MKLSSPLTILLYLLILLQTLCSAMTDIQFVENTCNNTPSPDLCLPTLLPNPESDNADLTGLALIGVSTVYDKGLEILHQVDELLNSRVELTSALVYCSEVYHAVVDAQVPSSKEALHRGVFRSAESVMADTAVESEACEKSFGEHGQTSPMTDSNNSMTDVANVVGAIIRMLL